MDGDQFDLFAPTPATPTTDGNGNCLRAPQGPRKSVRATRPEFVVEVLHDINHGRLGAVDDTDRVVVFEDDDRVVLSIDEDTALSLLHQRYVERCPPRDRRSCLHGVIRKPITPLRLTKSGRALLKRWSALRPL